VSRLVHCYKVSVLGAQEGEVLMRASDIRAALDEIVAELLRTNTSPHVIARLRAIHEEVGHRPALKPKPPAISVRCNEALRTKLREAAEEHPDLTYAEIGILFDVKGARVSEAVRGVRT
jgi:hypothetical protein